MISQNQVMLILDFDLTVTPQYQQNYLFKHIAKGNEKETQEMWQEWFTTKLDYQKEGMEDDLAHMHAFIDVTNISNQQLRDAGDSVEFNPGVLELFPRLRETLDKKSRFREHGIELVGSVISAGYEEAIKGSKLSPDLVDGGSAESDLDWLVAGGRFTERDGKLHLPAYTMTRSEKANHLHRLNKGPHISNVDDYVPDHLRAVPFDQMMYVGDGPSDIRVSRQLKLLGGYVHWVFNPEDPNSLEAVFSDGVRAGRVHSAGPWDFTAGTTASNTTYQFLERATLLAADAAASKREGTLRKETSPAYGHLNERRAATTRR